MVSSSPLLLVIRTSTVIRMTPSRGRRGHAREVVPEAGDLRIEGGVADGRGHARVLQRDRALHVWTPNDHGRGAVGVLLRAVDDRLGVLRALRVARRRRVL